MRKANVNLKAGGHSQKEVEREKGENGFVIFNRELERKENVCCAVSILFPFSFLSLGFI